MDDSTPTEGPPQDVGEGRRRSKDVHRHHGFITNLCVRWRSSGYFRGTPFDELFNIALIEADRLLRDKYDPQRTTVSSFLTFYLFPRVEYRVLRSAGQRKRPEGWIKSKDLDPPAIQREPPPHQATDWEDFLAAAHPDLRSVIRRLGDGQTIDEILAEDEAIPLFDSVRDSSRDELLAMLRSEVRRLFHER